MKFARPLHQFSLGSLLLATSCLAVSFAGAAYAIYFHKPLQLFVCVPLMTTGACGAVGAVVGRFWLFALCGLLLPINVGFVLVALLPID
jgi:hypothetical protein